MDTLVASSIPGDDLYLSTGGKDLIFFFNHGEIVSDPIVNENLIEFFMKLEDGSENDLTLETNIRANKGHRVSVLFAREKHEEIGYCVAWINHTTGKADYFKSMVREKIIGNKVSNFLLDTAEWAAISGTNFLSGGFFLAIILSPIIATLLGISIFTGVLGLLFGLNSEKSVKSVMRRGEEIVTSVNPSLAIYSEKPSKWWKVMKWFAIVFIAIAVYGTGKDMGFY